VESVLRGGGCLFLDFGPAFASGKFGEWVRDGGEDIGESCVASGGV
jgi:hypothetical protein